MKLSICCITYNHELFIKQAIDSFLMQQCNFDFEIVIGEDGSTDNTAEICKQYAKQYPDKIKLVCNNPNIGMMPNFINTIERCKGEYIALCEGDDYWTDSLKLQKQVDFLESNKDFNLCHHNIKIDSNKIISDRKNSANIKDAATIVDLTVNNFIQTCSVVFRNTINYFPEWMQTAMPGDLCVFFMAVGKSGKIKYINESMANYRVHTGGIWSQNITSANLARYNETLYKCLHEYDLDKTIVANKILLGTADNISLFKFKYVSVKRYLFFLLKLLPYSKLSVRQFIFVLTCCFRKK